MKKRLKYVFGWWLVGVAIACVADFAAIRPRPHNRICRLKASVYVEPDGTLRVHRGMPRTDSNAYIGIAEYNILFHEEGRALLLVRTWTRQRFVARLDHDQRDRFDRNDVTKAVYPEFVSVVRWSGHPVAGYVNEGNRTGWCIDWPATLMTHVVLLGIGMVICVGCVTIWKSRDAIMAELKTDRRTRALRAGRCPKCRYDLRMLAGTRCPECGENIHLDDSLVAPYATNV